MLGMILHAAAHLPSGGFQSASYSLFLMSSIVAPEEEAFRSGPLRINLPMEVVTVSTYVRPVASSFRTQLELMLEIPGAITSPIDRVPMGTSWSNSMRSGIFKQAVTPTKPRGGMGGFTSVNAFAGGEGSGREGYFGRRIGDFTGIIRESWWDLPLSLKVQVGWGISPVATTGRDGCSTFSHPTNFGALSLGCDSGTRGILGTSVGEGVIELFPSSASGTAIPWKTSSSVKVRYHFISLPELQYTFR